MGNFGSCFLKFQRQKHLDLQERREATGMLMEMLTVCKHADSNISRDGLIVKETSTKNDLYYIFV